MLRFVVVGVGKMASDVLKLLHAAPGADPVLAIGDPAREAAQSRLAADCAKLGVVHVAARRLDAPEVLAALRAADPDYIVSANNFMIFRDGALAAARRGVVNFHNGPLPRYGGLHACSWALFNGEREHGVTWHLVDSGIDSGPLLAQKRFPIGEEDTAIGLIARCIREGVGLFAEILPGLVDGTLAPRPQDHAGRLYYGAKDRPFGGDLPWAHGVEPARRLARALSFAPMPNLFFRPRIVFAQGEAFAGIVERPQMRAVEAGLVAEADADGVTIGLGEACLRLRDLRDAQGRPATAAALGLAVGSRLIDPTQRDAG